MKDDHYTTQAFPRHVTGEDLRTVLLQYSPRARITGVRVSGPCDRNCHTRIEVTTLDANDEERTHAHQTTDGK
jgi:hypothetical protein